MDKAKIPIALQMLWQQYPDLRFGQLLHNLFFDVDLTKITDEEIAERLDSALAAVFNEV